MRSATMVVAAVLLAAGNASAQQKASGANPAAAGIGNVHEMVKRYVIGAAELVPEERYSYQPTKDVRTFGQLRGAHRGFAEQPVIECERE